MSQPRRHILDARRRPLAECAARVSVRDLEALLYGLGWRSGHGPEAWTYWRVGCGPYVLPAHVTVADVERLADAEGLPAATVWALLGVVLDG